MGTQNIELSAVVAEADSGKRLDVVASGLFPEYSRGRLQQWIKSGELTVNGQPAIPRQKVFAGADLRVQAQLQAQQRWQPQAIDLAIVFEDEQLLVLNKPAGLVVHPAAGNADSTLLNALLHHCPALDTIPRAGIVHRLDKDTSGLLVVAKTLPAQHSLVGQLQARTMGREYEAVCVGTMVGGGTITEPIGRHPTARVKMAVTRGGKPAITHYRVLQRFAAHTHIGVKLETGRTHQIRVHMAHIRKPLLGDPVYGGRLQMPKAASAELSACLRGFRRQALHARRLGLAHPVSGDWLSWEAPLPEDMQQLLHTLGRESPA